ncbi:MAG TPA: hypothetical protein VGN81_22855 [Pseudonocardiaceae bacterium]|jgi:para-nitrobenzyl esterase
MLGQVTPEQAATALGVFAPTGRIPQRLSRRELGGVVRAGQLGLAVPDAVAAPRRGSGQPALLIGENIAEATALSARMRAAWTAFATSGDPGWPAYDADQRLTQLFDAQPTVTTYPEETSRRIWQDHTFSALPLLEK